MVTMILEPKLTTLEGLPEPFHALYTKAPDGFDLTGVKGFTPADREKTTKALRTERDSASAAVNAYKPWKIFGDRKPEEIQEELDKIEEYKAAAKGKLPEAEIEERANARVKRAMAPLERQLAELTDKHGKAEARIQGFERAEERAAIRAEIQRAAVASGAEPWSYAAGGGLLAVLEGVLEVEVETDGDGNRRLGAVRSKDGAGYPTGLDATALIREIQGKQPGYWPTSSGGGARNPGNGGSKGPNPWKKETLNRTEQMKIISSNPELAKQLQAAAGA
jgi:hypothetical protein